jgi:predicted double-glycine peptidase
MRLNPTAAPAVFLAIALYFFGLFLEKRTASRSGRLLLFAVSGAVALPGLLFALYYTHLFDNAAWFYRFRAVPYTELLVAGTGLFMGVLNSWFAPETFGEKLVIPAAMGVLLLAPFAKPLLDPIDLDHLRDRCDGDVCMQSTFSTCGPSSSATILKLLGKLSSEKQLARECLTSRGGTEIWYIARAFERRGLHARVEIQPTDQVSPPAPSIAGVVLPGGAGHFIAIMRETADDVTIGDPMKGKLIVKRADLKNYYHFTGFFLVIDAK